MKSNVFRTLRADEIECRAARGGQNKNGAWGEYLLYKDARVDQRIMDETFGPMNWQAKYDFIDNKLFCTVSVWDNDKGCWVSKMNVGTESNTEKEKGQASDSLKRACFTWGLGVELYSSPKIFINLNEGEYEVKNGKVMPTLRLKVEEIAYDDNRKVADLRLTDAKGIVRFGKPISAKKGPKNAKQEVNGAPSQKVFVADDGRKAVKGGEVWSRAVKKTAAGEVCEDGTPIPIFFADYYNVPNEDMKDFINEVKNIQNGNS